jgi:hypothetical protein
MVTVEDPDELSMTGQRIGCSTVVMDRVRLVVCTRITGERCHSVINRDRLVSVSQCHSLRPIALALRPFGPKARSPDRPR